MSEVSGHAVSSDSWSKVEYRDNLYSQGLSSLQSPGAERDYRDYGVIGVIGIIPNQSGRKEFKRVFVDPGGKKA